eukprot:6205272-Pleurochrysis_carterae.AAC.2
MGRAAPLPAATSGGGMSASVSATPVARSELVRATLQGAGVFSHGYREGCSRFDVVPARQ